MLREQLLLIDISLSFPHPFYEQQLNILGYS